MVWAKNHGLANLVNLSLQGGYLGSQITQVPKHGLGELVWIGCGLWHVADARIRLTCIREQIAAYQDGHNEVVIQAFQCVNKGLLVLDL